MLKKVSILVVVSCLFFVGGALAAFSPATYHFTPNDPDLGDLDHSKAYQWRINGNTVQNGSTIIGDLNTDGVSIISASLTFKNISNWEDEAAVLFINLLNRGGSYPVTIFDDNMYVQNNYFDGFDGGSTLLWDYRTTTDDVEPLLTYDFTSENLATLTTYLANGLFGIGLDPDCHYFNDGIDLYITTGIRNDDPPDSAVPEPATLLLFGSGLVALAGFGRKQLSK